VPSALLLNLLAAGSMVLMMPFVLEKGFSVEQYGYLMSVSTAASFACVLMLSVFKFSSRTRYGFFVVGFISSVLMMSAAYLADSFRFMAVLLFAGTFANTLGNSVFNASMMLALPEDKRGGILGFVSAACTGGSALSAVIFGVLCDLFSMELVFVAGNLLSLPLMMYLCFHKNTKEFVLEH